jgi:uncharacterized membrane protein YeaQ/YmgE (transglycosylase-associated protein family)
MLPVSKPQFGKIVSGDGPSGQLRTSPVVGKTFEPPGHCGHTWQVLRATGRRHFMDPKTILTWAVIGIVAGWLASLVMGGGGLLFYLIVGLLGAVVGGFLAKQFKINLNLGNATVNDIVVAAIGAIIVLFIARLIA